MSGQIQANAKSKPSVDCTAEIEKAQHFLDDILAANGKASKDSVLIPYNKMSMALDTASSKAGLLSQVHPDKGIRESAEMCEQEVSNFMTKLSLNRALYDVFVQLDPKSLSAEPRRLLDKTLRDFRRAGVDKSIEVRNAVEKLEDELVLIGQEFGRNIREDVRYIELDSAKDLDGLPKDFIDAHQPGKNGKIRITTDYPDYIPFMTYANNEEARKELSKKSLTRGYPVNEKVLALMIQKRHELATLLGYPSYAEYVVETKMIKSTARVEEFVEKIARISKPRSDQEYNELLEEKKKLHPSATQVFGYEKAYFEEKFKKQKFNFDSQTIRPYFAFNRVLEGVLSITGELFGVRYERVKDPSIWHDSVYVYDVFEGSKPQGRIFLDLFPRENKYKHAAQFQMKSGVEGKQLPQGALVCNFPQPSKNDDGLMDHDQVVTMFHEFGHLMHHILGGKQKWIRFSGVATEWDFVEAPSQFLEEWAWDVESLQKFAKHHKTGKAIPKELVAKMRAADEFGKGMAARIQMFYAMMSLQYYKKDPASFDPFELMKSLQKQYSPFPYVEGTHFHLSFGHLEGYSAMYYTYMWSEVIAKDLLSPFKKDGMMNLALARHYRDTILRPGGSKDAEDLVKDFLGRPYTFDAFEKWLVGSA